MKPFKLLDEKAIRHELLNNHFHEPIDCHLLVSIDSTNQFLKDLPRSAEITMCCAEVQTHGRGRFGRHWHSPFGENIYVSFRRLMDCCHSRLSGLSLVVSLAIVATLDELGISEDIRVKWPNDVQWLDKKLCGSLIEVTTEHHEETAVIIGIGLNVNSRASEHPLRNAAWCSLLDITGQMYDRNKVLAHLIIQLNKAMKTFLSTGFSAFAEFWKSVDYLYGLPITVTQRAGTIQGIAQGVTEAGLLILIDDFGKRHELSSGDTSLQPQLG
ncbi:MAG: biotin--[acetyl-CoA-carboxylase] ligase [Legionellales bacterium]|nr:biotin--[acetyl-CoA-carboxylase] ligase [Legionellales bacterium]